MKKFHDGQFLEKYKSLKFTYVCNQPQKTNTEIIVKLINIVLVK